MIESIDPADPRVSQANERTLLSWIRTGLALMAFGFVVERLAFWFGPEPGGSNQTVTLVLGAAIVGLGALCQFVGAVRFMAVKRALAEGRMPPSGATGPVLLALLSAIVGVALLVYLLAT
jgi:putative membrane protein